MRKTTKNKNDWAARTTNEESERTSASRNKER